MVTVLVAAQTTELTTVERVKGALRATTVDAARDAELALLIQEASAAIEQHLERPLGREQVEERLEGTDRTTMLVTRRPVVSIDQVDHDDLGSISLETIQLAEPGAGIVFREEGWISEAPRRSGLVLDTVPQAGSARWLLRMTAGYFLPGDDFSAKDFSLSADGVLTRLSGTMPLLRPGDVVRLAGFADGNNGRFPVTARTATTVTLRGTFTPETAVGADAAVSVKNLPGKLERACVEAVRAWYMASGRDPALTRESLGDWAAQYGGNGQFATVKRGTLPEGVIAELDTMAEVAQA